MLIQKDKKKEHLYRIVLGILDRNIASNIPILAFGSFPAPSTGRCAFTYIV